SISLTAIFASQGTAIKVAHRARKTTVAALLARCKMGEIEERIIEDGSFPAIELTEVDECCEDGEVEGFECEWIVELVELPQEQLEGDGAGMNDGDEGGDESATSAIDDLASGEGKVDDMLSGMGGGGGDMITELAMTYAYPILQPAIEAQIRRAKVTVRWSEGGRQHEFDVVQYLVAEPGIGGTDI
ncbi:MAG: hypothetical protein DRJ42_27295, partial [Deltaproteobacteria bacterium]